MGLYEQITQYAEGFHQVRRTQRWLYIVTNHFPPSQATVKFSDDVKRKLRIDG